MAEVARCFFVGREGVSGGEGDFFAHSKSSNEFASLKSPGLRVEKYGPSIMSVKNKLEQVSLRLHE